MKNRSQEKTHLLTFHNWHVEDSKTRLEKHTMQLKKPMPGMNCGFVSERVSENSKTIPQER